MMNLQDSDATRLAAFSNDASDPRGDAALEAWVRSIINQTTDACLLVDQQGRILSVNTAATKLLGFTEKRLLRSRFQEFVVDPDRYDHLWNSFETGGHKSANIVLKKKDGLMIVCRYSAWLRLLLSRNAVILRDISEEMKTEKDLRENEMKFKLERQRFADLFKRAPVSMCILKGRDHILVRTNALFDRLVAREALLGRPVREAFPDLAGQGWFELLDHAFETGETVSIGEKLVRFDAGSPMERDVYLNFMYQPIRNAEGQVEEILYFGIDITEQVLTRKKIEDSERRYRQIVETAQEGIWLLDKDHQTLFANQKMGEILGYSLEEIVGHRIHDFVDRDDPGSVERVVELENSSLPCRFEMRFLKRSGETVWGFLNTTRVAGSTGEYDGLLAMVTDVTERKKADEELQKLSLIARSTTNAIIISDSDGRIEWVNDAFTRMSGFSFHEVKGKSTVWLFGAEADEQTRQHVLEQVSKHQPFACEIIRHKKNGEPLWVEIQGRPVFNEKGKLSYYFNMETDITERKRSYQKLLKTENQIRIFARQLNYMLEDERSRLAREIHDEFGQQLTGLKMSLSYLEKLNSLPPEAGSIIRELLSGLDSTFQSLRNFATELRPGILDTLGLVPSIEWLARSFEKKSGISCTANAKVRQQVFEKDFSINYFRICQEALTNVVKHAEATEVKIQLFQGPQTLCMEIRDNGKGMDPEKLENPFSLGLLGMQERARLIGADLEVVSSPGCGTQIQIIGIVNGD